MTETEAREVLMLRAWESPPAAPWTDADAAAVSDEAARRVGSDAPLQRRIAMRAHLGIEKLAGREPVLQQALGAAEGLRGHGWTLVIGAAIAGLATDALGPSKQVNILAPPLLALLAWNLFVYALLIMGAIRRLVRSPNSAAKGSVAKGPAAFGPRAWFSALLDRLAHLRGPAAVGRRRPAMARFAADWSRAVAPLALTRAAALLHAAAAALAAGALASMYLRGLAFGFLAGWESTFLSAQGVHDLLAAVLGPAAQVIGMKLPDVAGYQALNFAVGPGENAARWIHLYAITIAGAVLLPRGLLALVQALRARYLTRHFELPLDDPYFRRLGRTLGGGRTVLHVLPYSYQGPADAAARLRVSLDERFGPNLNVRMASVLALGAEDDAASLAREVAQAAPTDMVAALFALTATPEHETHGAFVQALAAARGPAAECLVLIDESGFRRRFGGSAEASDSTDPPSRLGQRRQAWQRMLAPLGHEPVFVDLDAAALA
jgi:hypothetical protein